MTCVLLSVNISYSVVLLLQLFLFFFFTSCQNKKNCVFVESVDQSKFRTCEQTSFCRQHRVRNEETVTVVGDNILKKNVFKLWNNVSSRNNNNMAKDNTDDNDVIFSDNMQEGRQKRTDKENADDMITLSENKKELNIMLQFRSRQTVVPFHGTLSIWKPKTDSSSSPWKKGFSKNNPNPNPNSGKADIGSSYAVEFAVVENNPEGQLLDGKKRWVASDLVNREEGLVKCVLEKQSTKSDAVVSYAVKEKDENSVIQIKIWNEPYFHVTIWRQNVHLMTINAKGKMYFEPHRERMVKTLEDTAGTETVAVQEIQRRELTQEEEEKEVHGGKNIVDYGEDGLAIYDDGTVQAKTKAPSVDEPLPTTTDYTKPPESIVEEEEEEVWEEKFGSHTDSKPYGPASVGCDVEFYDTAQVYGIPEHASNFALKDTVTDEKNLGYTEPYRLYNLDVFEYDLDVPMALYGAIPVMMAHSPRGTSTGMFWTNPSETFIDIETTKEKTAKHVYWMSESGVIDMFLFLGPTAKGVLNTYTQLTGRPYLPPLFALAYHQCRWNYKSQDDVAKVNAGFEETNIPYDVLWLDIEHTDGKRYFTWDKSLFADPIEMQRNISFYGRKMVTIVDPHIKRDENYIVHKEATSAGVYVKQKDGVTDFDGWCWPGSSSYIDFTNPKARKWWADRFTYDRYIGSTNDLYTWNDMNEPSVFNGPEISMSKDVKNIEQIEHREWHNLYGMYMHQATMEGQLVRQVGLSAEKKDRPFVLSRSFFAGTQKFGAIWTGDNAANWESLEYATKMLLSMSIVSLSFVGADVGGFFGDPSTELLTRWYQVAIFQPFFRAHAHHDAKRREPFLFKDPTLSSIRKTILVRYSLLPTLYTLFYEASMTGTPVMRPLWMEFPHDLKTFAIDSSFLLGSGILASPIVKPGQVSSLVYLPTISEKILPTYWYNFWTYERYEGGLEVTVKAPLEQGIPIFYRGGEIFLKKMRLRRSSPLMKFDPYTIIIAADASNRAHGLLYLDDEKSMESTIFNLREFVWKDNTLSCSAAMSLAKPVSKYMPKNVVERVVVLGLGKAPTRISLQKNGEKEEMALTFVYDTSEDKLTVKKPNAKVVDSWKINLY